MKCYKEILGNRDEKKKKIDKKRILKTIKRLISDKSFLRDRVIFLEKD